MLLRILASRSFGGFGNRLRSAHAGRRAQARRCCLKSQLRIGMSVRSDEPSESSVYRSSFISSKWQRQKQLPHVFAVDDTSWPGSMALAAATFHIVSPSVFADDGIEVGKQPTLWTQALFRRGG